MYEELVKSLRICSRCDFGQDCNGCTRKSDDAFCCDKLLHEAADAIEELSKCLDNVNDAHNEGYDVGYWAGKRDYERKWIPVTERLPEDGKFVLVCNDDGHMMIAKHETETYEWYYKYTNYDFDIWDNEEQGPVRYWMPLPEPPKEES